MSRIRLAVLFGAAAGLSCVAGPMGLQAHDLPPDSARPGQCFGRVSSPPVYATQRRQVLVRKGWVETHRVPAVIDRVAHQVLVRPEVIEREHTPATYRTVVEWIEHPGEIRHVSEPARYETVREKVQVEAGHAEWRHTDAPLAYGETSSGQTLVQGTGEVMCRVWVPARYETTSRRVLVSPGRSYDVTGPSSREKVEHRELVSPGGVIEHRTPAVYRTEWVNRVFRQASSQVIEHPAVYRTVETQVLVRPGRQGWARLPVCRAPVVAVRPPPPPPPPPVVHRDCGCTLSSLSSDAPPIPAPYTTTVQTYGATAQTYGAAAPSPIFVARVQRALIGLGYDPGVPDGDARPQTYAALRQFQNKRGLPQTGMTNETARALGVN